VVPGREESYSSGTTFCDPLLAPCLRGFNQFFSLTPKSQVFIPSLILQFDRHLPSTPQLSITLSPAAPQLSITLCYSIVIEDALLCSCRDDANHCYAPPTIATHRQPWLPNSIFEDTPEFEVHSRRMLLNSLLLDRH
jgi:hypothetical protein